MFELPHPIDRIYQRGPLTRANKCGICLGIRKRGFSMGDPVMDRVGCRPPTKSSERGETPALNRVVRLAFCVMGSSDGLLIALIAPCLRLYAVALFRCSLFAAVTEFRSIASQVAAKNHRPPCSSRRCATEFWVPNPATATDCSTRPNRSTQFPPATQRCLMAILDVRLPAAAKRAQQSGSRNDLWSNQSRRELGARRATIIPVGAVDHHGSQVARDEFSTLLVIRGELVTLSRVQPQCSHESFIK